MKKYILSLLLIFPLASYVFASSLSTPSYVLYNDSMSVKKDKVHQVIESAVQNNASKIYIYYHDEKSQEFAIRLSNKITAKLPANCSLTIVDQNNSTPKYPSTITPEGVTLIAEYQ